MDDQVKAVMDGDSDGCIVCGDCLDILSAPAGKVDAVITDPPYGVDLGVRNDRRRDSSHLGRLPYKDYIDSYENFIARIVPRINMALDIADRGAVFSGPHIQEQEKAAAIGGIYCPAAIGRTSWGFKNFLPILFYGIMPDLHRGHTPIVLRSTAVVGKSAHPCPKPLAWMLWLVQKATRPGELVLDPFVGSGTTAVACKQTGRRCIGIEIVPEYAEMARLRLQNTPRPLFRGPVL